MQNRNAFLTLADRFQKLDPTMTKEEAFCKASVEVERAKAGQPISKDARRARSLTMRADALVREGKTREDAVEQADKELRLASARAAAKASIAEVPRVPTAPRSDEQRRADHDARVRVLQSKGVPLAAAMNLAWRETA